MMKSYRILLLLISLALPNQPAASPGATDETERLHTLEAQVLELQQAKRALEVEARFHEYDSRATIQQWDAAREIHSWTRAEAVRLRSLNGRMISAREIVVFNFAWPGAGFLGSGEYARGTVYAAGFGGSLAGALVSYNEYLRFRTASRVALARGDFLAAQRAAGGSARARQSVSLAGGLALFFYGLSVYDGVRYGERYARAASTGPESLSIRRAEWPAVDLTRDHVAISWKFEF